MSELTLKERLERLLGSDLDFYEQLCTEGFIPRDEAALSAEHLETARLARTLVQELEVNWAGVEVVLHMRAELMETRRQVHDLCAVVRQLQGRDEN